MDETDADPVDIPAGDVVLEGDLRAPADADGLVVFAHGSGSSRHSPRNNAVAATLRESGFATLLFDLLTEVEDETRENRFDISLLTDRLVAVTDWTEDHPEVGALPVGHFGASTGAAAALRTAARRPDRVEAVVSRGGRVDLAVDDVTEVRAPCLFIVGGNDGEVLTLNREVASRMDCEVEVSVVPDAGHLFEGPGELETVAELAAAWFDDHL